MKPLSASHIDKWVQCRRREAFIYRAGIREPSSPAADAGHAVHGVLEGKDVVPVGSYPIAEMAARLSSAAPPLLRQEYEFNVNLFGVDFTGRIDGQYSEGVLDFKTTSKAKYVKTERKLSKDVQRLLYVQVEPTAKETLWLYGLWSDLSVVPVRMGVDRKKDTEKFKLHVLKPAEEILSCPEDVDPLSLPAASEDGNSGACALFPPLGCPFKTKCFPPNEMSIAMSNLFEDLKKENCDPVGQDSWEKPAENLTEIEVNGQKTTGSVAVDTVLSTPQSIESKIQILTEIEVNGQKMTVDELNQKIGVSRPIYEPPPNYLPQVTRNFPIKNLYVDCFPIKISSPVTNAADLISKAATSVAADAHVPHALLVDYGKGGPMIAAQLAFDLKDAYHEHVVLETKSAEGKACLFKLMELSENVIKGFF